METRGGMVNVRKSLYLRRNGEPGQGQAQAQAQGTGTQTESRHSSRWLVMTSVPQGTVGGRTRRSSLARLPGLL